MFVGKKLTIQSIRSTIRAQAEVQAEALLPEIRQQMKCGFIYVEMDQAVCLGKYENAIFTIGIGTATDRFIQTLDPYVDNIKELRIFNKDAEFRAVRIADQFHWRLRVDTDGQGEDTCHILDEAHKLWGAVTDQTPDPGWRFLSNKRGCRILLPKPLATGTEVALCVRNYLTYHASEDKEMSNGELISFDDERLCGFKLWPEGGCDHDEV